MKLWLDSSDTSSIVKDEDNAVSQWLDKSGNGNRALSTSDQYRPTYVENQLNSKAVLRFNQDYLEFPDITTIRTVFFVLKKDVGSGGQRFILGDDSKYDFESNKKETQNKHNKKSNFESKMGNILDHVFLRYRLINLQLIRT